MSDDGGYVKSYRRKWEHPVFRNKQEAAVWAWMCDVAQWRDTRISTKFGPIELKRGELIIAERVLAEDFGLHRNTLRNLLERMQHDGMIERFSDRCPHRAGTVVKVLKYEEYQSVASVPEVAQDRKPTVNGTEEGPKEDRRRTKNNEVNKLNEGKIDLLLSGGIAQVQEADKPQAPTEFQEWYKQFPNKKDPDGALKAYLTVRKKGTSKEELLAGAIRYAAECQAKGTEKKFIKHPATWLNKGSWRNEPDLLTPTNGSHNVRHLDLARTYQQQPDIRRRAILSAMPELNGSLDELDGGRAGAF